jgi:hypothetical protein
LVYSTYFLKPVGPVGQISQSLGDHRSLADRKMPARDVVADNVRYRISRSETLNLLEDHAQKPVNLNSWFTGSLAMVCRAFERSGESPHRFRFRLEDVEAFETYRKRG